MSNNSVTMLHLQDGHPSQKLASFETNESTSTGIITRNNSMQTNNDAVTNQRTDLQQRFTDLLPAPHRLARRSFLRSLGLGAALLTPAAGVLNGVDRAATAAGSASNTINAGDAAILRFLAAAELLETDLWQQYAELGGVTAGKQNSYQKAFARLDGDGAQYITSNTL